MASRVVRRLSGEKCLAPAPGRFGACQFDPNWRVVAGLFPSAHSPIDARGLQSLSDGRAQQQMIDPEPGVTGVGVSEIVPERVNALAGVKRSQRVGPTLIDKPAVGFTDFRAK